MESIRRKMPAIDIDDDYIGNRKLTIIAVLVGIFSLAATLGGVYVLVFGIIHRREIPYLGFAGFLIFLLWTLGFATQTTLCFNGIATGISNIVKRNRWLKQAIRSQVKIIDRREEHNVYAESREEMWECSLAILWPPSTEGELHGNVAWLEVSDRIYSRYRDQDVAHILYDPSDSHIFIFEGE